MGYELRVERESPLVFSETAKAVTPAGFELRETGEILARHVGGARPVANWGDPVIGVPGNDWEVAQLVLLSQALGGRLTGEDGELYTLRDGMIEVVAGGDAMPIGAFDEIMAKGPADWSR